MTFPESNTSLTAAQKRHQRRAKVRAALVSGEKQKKHEDVNKMDPFLEISFIENEHDNEDMDMMYVSEMQVSRLKDVSPGTDLTLEWIRFNLPDTHVVSYLSVSRG